MLKVLGSPVPIVLKSAGGESLESGEGFWTRAKSDLKDEDYQAFYQHLARSQGARVWAHNKVSNIEYTSLLYLPKRAV